jgi:hypothetical protein
LKIRRTLLCTCLLPIVSAAAQNSNIGNVALSATLPQSLTVTVISGTNINFNLSPNTAVNVGSGTTTVMTTWAVSAGVGSLVIWAYFASTTAALVHQTGGGSDIPSAAVKIQVGGGANSFSPLANVSPFNAAPSGVQIGPAISINGSNENGSRTDTMAYQIDTTVVPQLPADSYIGTLNIQAQATP